LSTVDYVEDRILPFSIDKPSRHEPKADATAQPVSRNWCAPVVGKQSGDDVDSDCSSSGAHATALKSLTAPASCSRDHGPSNHSSTDSSSEEPTAPSDTYRYQRRRSRAVLYQLSGTYGKKRATASKLQLHKVKQHTIHVKDEIGIEKEPRI